MQPFIIRYFIFLYEISIIILGLIIFTGGNAGGGSIFDTILEYNHDQETIKNIGQMSESRSDPGISVVKSNYYSPWCE